jgi:hypothetical protein
VMKRWAAYELLEAPGGEADATRIDPVAAD